MLIDRPSLNLAAAVLSTIASVIAIGSALRSRSGRAGGLVGLVSSLAWTAVAYQEYAEQDVDVVVTVD